MPFCYLEDIATADVAFEAWGATMEDMFAAAAEATLQVMVEAPRRMGASVCREISLEAESVEMLLFDLIEALVFYKDAEQLLLLPTDPVITRQKEAYRLSARGCGRTLSGLKGRLRVDVKAPTLHRFEARETPGGWKAIVVLDI